MKVSVYIAASLDGFIARADGALDWLPGADPAAEPGVAAVEEGEDYGWADFWESVDCLILGRKSFEKVLGFGYWPYGGKRVIVLSRTQTAVPQELAGRAAFYGGELDALVAGLLAEGYERLYIDGGQTIQSFLRAGLVSDMTISTVPILIGAGIPLFGPLPVDIPLKHIETKTFASGFVQSTYEIVTG